LEFELITARIILALISIFMMILFLKIFISKRLGLQLFIVTILFWSSLLIISLKPNILDIVIASFGLDNRAQILLSISVVFVVYFLISQIIRNKGLSANLFQIVRKVAISNFKEQIIPEKNLKAVIVIPAKNEEKTIGQIIEKIHSQKLPFSYKILVINDGSTDDTALIAKNNGALVVNHEYNLGIGGAVKTGYVASKILNPEIVINIDADGQHDPKFISSIISKIQSGSDLIYCSRFKDNQSETTKIRLFGNRFFTNLTNKLTGLSLTDVTTGYRGIKTEKISSIYFSSETNFAIELACRAAKNKLKIDEIPIIQIARQEGFSQFHKLEKFIIYNINVIFQIFNAKFRHPSFD